MPSYRAQLAIGNLLPGHRPEEVMDAAVLAIGSIFHVDAQLIDVHAGRPWITVRYTVPDAATEAERAAARSAVAAAAEAVGEVAEVTGQRLLVRAGGRWFPVELGPPPGQTG